MNTRPALTVSSIIAGSLLTFASAPALASHLDSARSLAESVTPAGNAWGTPCNIDFASGTAASNGACLFTLSLRDDDPTITAPQVAAWWGSINPNSVIYYNQINAQNHFTKITNVVNIQEGDVIAVKTSATTGYLMIVDVAPSYVSNLISSTPTSYAGRYLASVIDSVSTTPHGDTDSRWMSDTDASGLAVHDQGVGMGDIYLDANDNGEIVAHVWSVADGVAAYSQVERPLVVGRFVK